MVYLGGTKTTPQATRTIRYAGLAVPLLLAVYGILCQLDIITGIRFENTPLFTYVSIVWIAVALWQFLAPAQRKSTAIIRLSLFHLFAAIHFLFITGIATPLVALWLVLLLASYLYFDVVGSMMSITFLILVVIATIILDTPSAVSIAAALTTIATLITVACVVMNVHKAQAVDRRELQRSHKQEVLQRDRILTIVNNLADAVLSTDQNGIIRVYNAASLSLLDTNDSLSGHHIDTVLPLVDSDGASLTITDILKQATSVLVRDDTWYVFEDDERVRLELTVSPIRTAFNHASTGKDGYVIIMRDVTKAKSLEEERDEFISVVSHELRTPITVAEGSLSNLELMLQKSDIGKDRIQDAVAAAHDQTLYLAKMVNDLSALSRAERGVADEREVIDVKELVKTLYDKYAPRAHEKQLTFDLDVRGTVGKIEVSRLYTEEILQNLITNAIKYTKTGGVTFSASKQDDLVTFSVKDTGIGISKTDHAKIFGKFYRSEDYRTRETGGTGLGLYVVTKLARKIGTTIELKSRLNYGSTFYFSIPSYQPPKKQSKKS